MKKIYLSGKITGKSIKDNFHYFDRFEYEYKLKGYEVVNPTSFPILPDYQKQMQYCFAELKDCNKIIMLPNWNHSKGAKLELEYAKHNNIEVEYIAVEFDNSGLA